MYETLTLDTLYEAYDRLYQFPPEEYWYVCHPDDLAGVQDLFARVRWGTCPLVQASKWAERGKVLQVRNQEPLWSCPWQQ